MQGPRAPPVGECALGWDMAVMDTEVRSRRGYLLLKSGGRFSPNAASPSPASSEANAR